MEEKQEIKEEIKEEVKEPQISGLKPPVEKKEELTFMEKYEKDLRSLIPRQYDREKQLKEQLKRTQFELDFINKMKKARARFSKIKAKLEHEKELTETRIRETQRLTKFYHTILKSL